MCSGFAREEFYRPSTPPEINLNGKTEKASIDFYEVLEPRHREDYGPVYQYSREVAGYHGQQLR